MAVFTFSICVPWIRLQSKQTSVLPPLLPRPEVLKNIPYSSASAEVIAVLNGHEIEYVVQVNDVFWLSTEITHSYKKNQVLFFLLPIVSSDRVNTIQQLSQSMKSSPHPDIRPCLDLFPDGLPQNYISKWTY